MRVSYHLQPSTSSTSELELDADPTTTYSSHTSTYTDALPSGKTHRTLPSAALIAIGAAVSVACALALVCAWYCWRRHRSRSIVVPFTGSSFYPPTRMSTTPHTHFTGTSENSEVHDDPLPPYSSSPYLRDRSAKQKLDKVHKLPFYGYTAPEAQISTPSDIDYEEEQRTLR